eukprot:COSAG01_NODE_909_length_12785_cov_4.201876_14_plen_65_part_00
MERQQSALMERIIHAPQNTIDQLFRQIDSNSDGRIVKEEFLANGAEVLARLLTRFEFKRPKEWG